MRTTLRIDDDLMRTLKARARREKVPLTQLVNRVIRQGIEAGDARTSRAKKTFRQKTYSMGEARFDVTKALALAAALEDEAIIEKLAKGK
jgi:hypothetical protein